MRQVLSYLVSVSLLIVLTACNALPTALPDSSSSIIIVTPIPTRVIRPTRTALPTSVPTVAKRETPLLPEAGVAQKAIQPTVPPTATLPPTALPATATPQPTLPPPTIPPPTIVVTVSSGVPVRLIIPAIGLDAPVVPMGWSIVVEDGQQVSEWDVPTWRAAGWLNNSALIGAPGNTVLEGHQDIDGRVFENLEYLKEGDEIQVQTESQLWRYVIVMKTIVLEKDQPLEVRQQNARWIAPSSDERLTLVTCWPRNDNTHRLILVALPAP